MPKQSQYDYVGSTHTFKKRPPKKDDDGWFWGVAFAVLIVFLLSTCS